MDTRRTLFLTALGTAAVAVARRTGLAQPAAGQQQCPGPSGCLRDRGTPGGRVGAATRGPGGAHGAIALNLVAPSRGVGLTSVDQPTLCYLLSGVTDRPVRLAVSVPGQARPLAHFELPRAQPPTGLGVVRLRDHGIRLPEGPCCVWSVELVLDPRAPSQDVVASASIQHRPADPAVKAAAREPAPERHAVALACAGYWYDAVALAEQNRSRDGGAALVQLLELEELAAQARRAVPSLR